MSSSAVRSAVKVSGLRKSFGNKVILDGLDLDVAERTLFALLGPNGAGKTTAVQIVSTLLSADAGDVVVAGHDLRLERFDLVEATRQIAATYSGGMQP
jgi:ABC-2 type transport system ATP-binding protein